MHRRPKAASEAGRTIARWEGPTASVVDKPAFLRSIGEPPSVESYNLDDVAVSFYGDAALVRAKGSWVAKDGNRGISRYIDVYARIGGSWKAVSAQITRPPGTVAR